MKRTKKEGDSVLRFAGAFARLGAALVLAQVVVAGGVACSKPEPGAGINKLRSTYSVQLNSYRLEQTPLESDDEGQGSENPESAGVVSMAELNALANVRTDVELDIIVGTTSEETLGGLTVEFEHVDAERQVKNRRRLWIETTEIKRGSGSQVYARVEDVDYVEGDAFAVSLRGFVPAEEQAEYREFAASPGS